MLITFLVYLFVSALIVAAVAKRYGLAHGPVKHRARFLSAPAYGPSVAQYYSDIQVIMQGRRLGMSTTAAREMARQVAEDRAPWPRNRHERRRAAALARGNNTRALVRA